MRTIYLFLGLPLLLGLASSASADKGTEICQYVNAAGKVKMARSKTEIPYRYRAKAVCQATQLAAPEKIKLEGNIASQDVLSSLGTIKLRWPRTVERLFGKSPLHAVTDTARTVSRAVRTSDFPYAVQNLNADFDVVFMDENLPRSQIPSALVNRCHPGWMVPPTNIYVAAQRVAAGCGSAPRNSRSVADADLVEVLLHEFGHSVEYHMLKEQFGRDRMRAEGFATWFEMHAARYSSILRQSQIKDRTYRAARKSLRENPSGRFGGTGEDYARASMYFVALEKKRGVRGISEVYRYMAKKKVPFFVAVKEVHHLSRAQLDEAILKILRN